MVGYNVYRSILPTTGFAKVNTTPVMAGTYTDASNLAPGTTYYYYLAPIYDDGKEGRPSTVFTVTIGTVRFEIPDSFADTGKTGKVPVTLPNADGLTICTANITVLYSSAVLQATAISNSAFTPGFKWSANTDSPGVAKAIVILDSDTTLRGPGAFFHLHAEVRGEWDKTSTIQIDATNSSITDCNLNNAPIDASDTGIFTVRADFTQGDTDGDGAVTTADVDELKALILGKVMATRKQTLAGDLNNEQRLTSADLILLKRLVAGKPLVPSTGIQTAQADGAQPTITINLPVTQIVEAGEVISIPIQIDMAAGIAAFEAMLNYDPAIVTPTAIYTTVLSADFAVDFAILTPGQVKLTAVINDAALNGLTGGSDGIVMLVFTGLQANATTPLHLAFVRLSDAYGQDFVQSVLQRFPSPCHHRGYLCEPKTHVESATSCFGALLLL